MSFIRIAVSRWVAAVENALLWLRIHYLNAVTFGAWKYLGEQVIETQNEVSRLEWRVDEFMRYWEQFTGEPIPGHIEPPRLTAHGELEDPRSWRVIGEEAERAKKAIEDFKAEEAQGASSAPPTQ